MTSNLLTDFFVDAGGGEKGRGGREDVELEDVGRCPPFSSLFEEVK